MTSFISFLKGHKDVLAAFFLTLVVGGAVLFISPFRYENDDQFIQYRYVDNIVSGQGFVYNVGERVNGSSTALFTLFLSTVKFAFASVPTPELTRVVETILIAVAGIFFFLLARGFLSRPWAFAATLVFAFDMSRVVPESMEASLFVLLLFSLLWCLKVNRWYASGVLLGLAVLTRPDAGLIAPLIGLFWLQKTGLKKAVLLTVVSVATVLPWYVFSFFYFGSLIPQSVIIKLHSHEIYSIPPLQALKVQLAAISRLYWGAFFNPDNLIVQTFVNLLPVLAVVGIAAWKQLRANWLLFAIPFVYLVVFSISNPIIFPWYLSEMEPLWILLSFAGFAYVIGKLPHPFLRGLVIALIFAGPAFYWYSLATLDKVGSKMAYVDIAKQLETRLSPGDTIGIADIGIVGYQTHAYIYDFIAHVTPDALPFYPITDGCGQPNVLYTIPTALIQHAMPIWLIASSSQLEPCLLRDPWFAAHYSPEYANQTATVWHLVH